MPAGDQAGPARAHPEQSVQPQSFSAHTFRDTWVFTLRLSQTPQSATFREPPANWLLPELEKGSAQTSFSEPGRRAPRSKGSGALQAPWVKRK